MDSLLNLLQDALSVEIFHIEELGSTHIGTNYKAYGKKGIEYFIKTAKYNEERYHQLQTELSGLKILSSTNTVLIPKTYHVIKDNKHCALVLEFINTGFANKKSYENFGRNLAALHQISSDAFGLDHNNYIANLIQINKSAYQFVDWYAQYRLLPQFKLASSKGFFDSEDRKALESVIKKMSMIIPREVPSLIHGDLWSGNYIVARNNEIYLIDPAISYGHRELDLAMMDLFGGFDEAIIQSYQNQFPIEKGFEKRSDLLKLYYLLVHVNIFGRSYVDSVVSILNKFK